MSNGQTVILAGDQQRQLAHRLIERAPPRAVLTISEEKRSGDQNALMWALLSDVSRAKPEGRTLTPDVWKALFMHALDHTLRFEQALDGKGMVPVGFRSSRLSKARMTDLIETIFEYGARHGIKWSGAASERLEAA
jgi:hypothetical protein